MRRVNRQALPIRVQRYLTERQAKAQALRQAGHLDVEVHWRTSRQTQAMGQVLTTLQAMAGPRQRCMYCLDGHGSDIEHFRPKTTWPAYLYHWPNLLLCCTHCGRIKGSRFPLRRGKPLLINPAEEDPWRHLDLDPVTGNLAATWDLKTQDWSAKGLATVDALQLDRREALALGYQKTLRRLSQVVEAALQDPALQAPTLVSQLQEQDDHGLLGWCFSPRGARQQPFSTLRQQHPAVWRACRQALGAHPAQWTDPPPSP